MIVPDVTADRGTGAGRAASATRCATPPSADRTDASTSRSASASRPSAARPDVRRRARARRPRALRGESGRAATARGCSRGALPGGRAAGVGAAARRRRAGRGHDAALRPADRRPRHRPSRPPRAAHPARATGCEPALGPADFLPAAERTDLVLRTRPLGARSARSARWPRRGRARRACCFEVNVSARSLDDPELGRLDPRAAQGGRGGAGAARPGDHRDRRDQQPRRRALPRPAAHRGGLRLHARRLRRRVRLVLPPQEPAVHRRQDRGRVRAAGRRPTPSTAR